MIFILEHFLYRYYKKTGVRMKRIKIKKPIYKIPLENIISLYKRELNTKILKNNPSYENKIIEKNKRYFSHIGVG